jgi:hypothetical protein
MGSVCKDAETLINHRADERECMGAEGGLRKPSQCAQAPVVCRRRGLEGRGDGGKEAGERRRRGGEAEEGREAISARVGRARKEGWGKGVEGCVESARPLPGPGWTGGWYWWWVGGDGRGSPLAVRRTGAAHRIGRGVGTGLNVQGRWEDAERPPRRVSDGKVDGTRRATAGLAADGPAGEVAPRPGTECCPAVRWVTILLTLLQ